MGQRPAQAAGRGQRGQDSDSCGACVSWSVSACRCRWHLERAGERRGRAAARLPVQPRTAGRTPVERRLAPERGRPPPERQSSLPARPTDLPDLPSRRSQIRCSREIRLTHSRASRSRAAWLLGVSGGEVVRSHRAGFAVSAMPEMAWMGHAPGTIRTCGLCHRRAALYPLSYGRVSVPVYRVSCSERPMGTVLASPAAV